MKTGTIVLTPFPFTDLSINKLRPAVVISPVTPNSSDVIVAFISSVVPSRINTCDYVFSDSHSDFRISGLKKSSVFKMDKLVTLDKKVFLGELGEISSSTILHLQVKLKIALGLT